MKVTKKNNFFSKKEKSGIGLSLIIAGLIFLIDPYIVVIDVLPDFIGYLLIFIGLQHLSYLNLSMAEARKCTIILLIISFCRLPASLLYISIASDKTQQWGLIFAIAFAICEIIYGKRMFEAFFDGIYDFACCDDNLSIEMPLFSHHKECKIITSVFIVMKSVLSALPELTTLASTDYGVVTSNGISTLADYHGIFTIFSAVIVLIFGIYWYVRFNIYLKSLKNDIYFVNTAKTKCDNAESCDSKKREIKTVLLSLFLFCIAFILSFEPIFDNINYLPHAIFAGVFLISFLILSSKFEAAKTAIVPCITYIVVSLASWIYSVYFVLSFFSDFLNDSSEGLSFSVSSVLEVYISKSIDILYKFIGMCIASFIDSVFFVIFLIALRMILARIIDSYTGGTYAPDGHLIGSNEVLHTQKSLRNNLNLMFCMGIISAVSSVLRTSLTAVFPTWWLFDTIIRIIFIAVALKLIFNIRYCIKDKYDINS